MAASVSAPTRSASSLATTSLVAEHAERRHGRRAARARRASGPRRALRAAQAQRGRVGVLRRERLRPPRRSRRSSRRRRAAGGRAAAPARRSSRAAPAAAAPRRGTAVRARRIRSSPDLVADRGLHARGRRLAAAAHGTGTPSEFGKRSTIAWSVMPARACGSSPPQRGLDRRRDERPSRARRRARGGCLPRRGIRFQSLIAHSTRAASRPADVPVSISGWRATRRAPRRRSGRAATQLRDRAAERAEVGQSRHDASAAEAGAERVVERRPRAVAGSPITHERDEGSSRARQVPLAGAFQCSSMSSVVHAGALEPAQRSTLDSVPIPPLPGGLRQRP